MFVYIVINISIFLLIISVVASDIDASVVRGPNPEPRPWIPVVAFLEPLPRPTKAPSMFIQNT